jgi:hypothetical protein
MLDSFSCWRSVSLPGFFHSAKRAPLRSFASCLLPARLASFQTSRRISSNASVDGLDDMKRVKADHGVGAALGDWPGDLFGVIAGHQLDLLTALVA